MNEHLFAMAQGQVSEGLLDCPNLTAGASRGAARRMSNMIAIGAVAAFSLGAAPNEAVAQSTPQQFQQELQLNQQRHAQNMARDREQNEFNRERRQQEYRNQQEYRRDAQKSQVKQAVVGGFVAALTGAVVGAIAQSAQAPRPVVVGQNPSGVYPPGYAPSYAPSRQAYQPPQVSYPSSLSSYDPRAGSYDPRNGSYDPRSQVHQPAFYSPRDLGMPERFVQVSQRAGIGMAAPGSEHFNLNDGSATSDRVVRALSQLKGSLDHQQQAQRYLDDIRLSSYQIPGQQQQQANQAVSSANSQIDRSIENYMRMSNAAALEGKNTQAFNMLAAKMVLEGIAPDQRINMVSQPQQRYGFSPNY